MQQLPPLLGTTVYYGKNTTHKTLETTCNARAWHQQFWMSCANGSNIVALRFGDHGTKEMLLAQKSDRFKLCAAFPNNIQQGVQTDGTCNIQQGWKMLANNVASVSTGL